MKSHFWKGIPEERKLKEGNIRENYHFWTKHFSSFLILVYIYIYKISYTKSLKSKFLENLLIKIIQPSIKI